MGNIFQLMCQFSQHAEGLNTFTPHFYSNTNNLYCLHATGLFLTLDVLGGNGFINGVIQTI